MLCQPPACQMQDNRYLQHRFERLSLLTLAHPVKAQQEPTKQVLSSVCNLQSNVAVYLIQLINQLIDLLHDQGLALPHRAAFVLPAGLCLGVRFCFWDKGDGGARAG